MIQTRSFFIRSLQWMLVVAGLVSCQRLETVADNSAKSQDTALVRSPADAPAQDSGLVAEVKQEVGAGSTYSPPEIPSAFVPPGYERSDIPADFRLRFLANGEGEQSLYSFIGPHAQRPVDGLVVTFVASWCGRCKESYATLEEMQEKYQGRLHILMVDVDDDPESRQRMVESLREKNIDLPLLEGTESMIAEWLGPRRNIPRFFLIDHNGVIRVKDTGFGQKMAKLLPSHIDWLLARRLIEAPKKEEL